MEIRIFFLFRTYRFEIWNNSVHNNKTPVQQVIHSNRHPRHTCGWQSNLNLKIDPRFDEYGWKNEKDTISAA